MSPSGCEASRKDNPLNRTICLANALIRTGLRPGEKLYEELLIDAESQPTTHPLIYRAQERSVPPHELWPKLAALNSAIAAQDMEAALGLLAELVPEWRRA